MKPDPCIRVAEQAGEGMHRELVFEVGKRLDRRQPDFPLRVIQLEIQVGFFELQFFMVAGDAQRGAANNALVSATIGS
jgi:hypothetical protein